MSSGASEARSSPAGSSEAGSSTPSVVLPAQPPGDDDLFYLCRPHAHHLRCAPPTEAGFAEALAAATDAQVKYVDEYGHTVVIWMLASYDWPDQVAALLARGVPVNATTNVGFTALHYAGRDDRRASARVLLAHGADRTIKNVGGDTAAASPAVRQRRDRGLHRRLSRLGEKIGRRRRRRSAMRRRGRNARKRRPRRRERLRRRRRRRRRSSSSRRQRRPKLDRPIPMAMRARRTRSARCWSRRAATPPSRQPKPRWRSRRR